MICSAETISTKDLDNHLELLRKFLNFAEKKENMGPELIAVKSNNQTTENGEKEAARGGVILNSTSLENVVSSEHNCNRAQSVQSLHTEEDVETPTPTPISESPTRESDPIDESLRNSEKRINKLQRELELLVGMKDAFKSKMHYMQKNKDIDKSIKSSSESGEDMSVNTQKIHEALKKLENFMNFQKEVEQKLDNNCSFLHEQEDTKTLDASQASNSTQTLQPKHDETKEPGFINVGREVPILHGSEVCRPTFYKEPAELQAPESAKKNLPNPKMPPVRHLNTAAGRKQFEEFADEVNKQSSDVENERSRIKLLIQQVVDRKNELDAAVKYSDAALLRNSLTPTPSPAPPGTTMSGCLKEGSVPTSIASDTVNNANDSADKGDISETHKLINEYDEKTEKYKKMLNKLLGLTTAATNVSPDSEEQTPKKNHSNKYSDSVTKIANNSEQFSAPKVHPTAPSSAPKGHVLSTPSSPVDETWCASKQGVSENCNCFESPFIHGGNVARTEIRNEPNSCNTEPVTHELLTYSLVQCHQIIWQQQKELEAAKTTMRMLYDKMRNCHCKCSETVSSSLVTESGPASFLIPAPMPPLYVPIETQHGHSDGTQHNKNLYYYQVPDQHPPLMFSSQPQRVNGEVRSQHRLVGASHLRSVRVPQYPNTEMQHSPNDECLHHHQNTMQPPYQSTEAAHNLTLYGAEVSADGVDYGNREIHNGNISQAQYLNPQTQQKQWLPQYHEQQNIMHNCTVPLSPQSGKHAHAVQSHAPVQPMRYHNEMELPSHVNNGNNRTTPIFMNHNNNNIYQSNSNSNLQNDQYQPYYPSRERQPNSSIVQQQPKFYQPQRHRQRQEDEQRTICSHK